jgi:heavy metal translocating P-type ATPase
VTPGFEAAGDRHPDEGALCSHCQLPLPRRPVIDGDEAFCCAGCRTVFRLVGREGGESGWYLAKLALAAILSGNVMMFQLLLYVDSYRALGLSILQTTSWIMLALSVAVYLLLGAPMLVYALASLKRGRLGMELLISAGSLAAIAASARATIIGSYRTYYDSGTMILVLVTLGAYLDARSREKATAVLRGAVVESVRSARLRRGASEVEIPPEQVAPGDIVLVRAGERIPTDGEVLSGASDIEEAALTGEFGPRRASVGDRVFAGSSALDGPLEIRSSGVTETLASRIQRLAEQARARRAPIALMADRISSVFVPAVLAVSAAALLAGGLLRHDWARGGLSALSVLVVACPCALGLATPLATTVALSRAASDGTIIRSGRALETLARVHLVAFDKTGTLTLGRPTVSETTLVPDSLAAAAAVEGGVNHPFAAAVVEEAARRGLSVRKASEVRSVPGAGAEGKLDGMAVIVGSREFLASRGIEVPKAETQDAELWCALGGKLAGAVRLRDRVRPEARGALAALRKDGMETILLSGDREPSVQRVAEELSIGEAKSGLSPEGKAAEIAAIRSIERSAVAMVGDGVNDAAALDAADVGIAFGRAADLAREHSEVSVLREDLNAVVELFRLSKTTLRAIRVNLFWAFAYNVAGIGLAAAGRLSPVMAAVAMVLSSLFVVGNSLRLRTGEL